MAKKDFVFDSNYLNSIFRKDCSDDRYKRELFEFFLRFIKYLKSKNLSDASIDIYVKRLFSKFLNEGFSLNDLLGSLDIQIKKYSREGACYDPVDRNNTLSALKHLRDFYHKGKSSLNIQITLHSGFQSFAANHSDHAIFTVKNRMIITSKQQIEMDESDYRRLCELIEQNKNLLSKSFSAMKSFHGPVNYISYEIGDINDLSNYYSGVQCAGLFSSEDENESSRVNRLNKVFFEDIVGQYIDLY